MPVYEGYKSDIGQDGNRSKDTVRTHRYFAVDYPNLAAAKLALGSYGVPDTISILGGPDLRKETLTWDQLGPDCWEFRQRYVHPDRREEDVDTGSYLFSFDTTGGKQRIFQTREPTLRRKYVFPGENPPDFNGVIGWDGERAEGVEIVVPSLQFEITKRQPRGQITQAYVTTLRGLTGKVNNATFLGYPAGEVMFMGARGRQSTEDDPEVTYYFVISENLTGIQIGGVGPVDKKGHEYLWVFYQVWTDQNASVQTKRPHTVVVDTVSKISNFGALVATKGRPMLTCASSSTSTRRSTRVTRPRVISRTLSGSTTTRRPERFPTSTSELA